MPRTRSPKNSLPEFRLPRSNRLAQSVNPYLRTYGGDPVDWHPWGEEAFAFARKADKPVFLAIGFSSCHKCRVLHQECFQREDVALLLNQYFIPVMVDRQEWPVLDDYYMQATQLLTGRGGWPIIACLTAEKKPWFAELNISREDTEDGRPGLKTLLVRLAGLWKDSRDEMEAHARRVEEALDRIQTSYSESGKGGLTRAHVEKTLAELLRTYDKANGGFGGAPKFPPYSILNLLWYEFQQTKNETWLGMASRTLDSLAEGGIRDHVGGGFHRFSKDEKWFLPSFEKMIFDNAQLARTFVQGYWLNGDKVFRQVAMETYDWMLRELRGEEPAFFTGVGGESGGREGDFYLWKESEIQAALGRKESEFFKTYYGVSESGNLQGIPGEWKTGENLLYWREGQEPLQEGKRLSTAEVKSRLAADLLKLRAARKNRPAPERDEQVIASWNGLAIGSLAYGGKYLLENRYQEAAEQCAGFILRKLRSGKKLLHGLAGGKVFGQTTLNDYAFVISGLLDLYESTQNPTWLKAGRELMEVFLKGYWDRKTGGFFWMEKNLKFPFARGKNPFDRPMPSGNGLAAQALIRLAQMTNQKKYLAYAHGTLMAFRGLFQRNALGMESLSLALDMYLDKTSVQTQERVVAREGAGEGREKKPVQIKAVLGKLHDPQLLSLRLCVAIQSGWHIQAHQPLQPFLFPTQVELEENPWAAILKAEYPQGKRKRLPGNPELLSIYRRSVKIQLTLLRYRTPREKHAELKLILRYQPCEGEKCGPVDQAEISVPLE